MDKDTAATARAAAMERVCRRCKEKYSPSENTPQSCMFHPSIFVCRRHDDQKRYYELKDGDPPYTTAAVPSTQTPPAASPASMSPTTTQSKRTSTLTCSSSASDHACLL